uniref:Uncharacterized protein n=1 Tax=Romanomermis culicivorax TaxID=13658 RepID=A0A915KCK3_ROMCU
MRLEDLREDSAGSSEHDTAAPLLPPPPQNANCWIPTSSVPNLATNSQTAANVRLEVIETLTAD